MTPDHKQEAREQIRNLARGETFRMKDGNYVTLEDAIDQIVVALIDEVEAKVKEAHGTCTTCYKTGFNSGLSSGRSQALREAEEAIEKFKIRGERPEGWSYEAHIRKNEIEEDEDKTLDSIVAAIRSLQAHE